MATDFEIGRVVGVDTAQVSIELNRDLKGMSRSTYEGPQEVGRINSYVIIPVGARRLVAMVNRVVLVEEAEMKADRTMVALPAARRLIKATLIGTIDGNSFRQGVALFPVLDNPVYLAGRADLDAIFGPVEQSEGATLNPDQPGYCIPIGESAVVQGRPIRIDPDAFFGKHAAILGSTGSGKSCTIASILQSVRAQPGVKRTTCVILDTNGEYRTAFQNQKADGTWENAGPGKALYIPSDPRETAERLVIPYWFMNAEDFVRLFRASEGLQSPVLLRALRLARTGSTSPGAPAAAVEVLRTACQRIRAHCENDTPSQQYFIPGNIARECEGGLEYRKTFPNHANAIDEAFGADVLKNWEEALRAILEIAKQAGQQGNQGGLSAVRVQQIRDALDPVIDQLNRIIAERPQGAVDVSADQPRHFDRSQFLESALETAMREQVEYGNPGRVRDACGPMFLRIRRYFEDPRFRFIFDAYPQALHVLSAFLRDTLGIGAASEVSLSSEEDVPKGRLPFYDRQRGKESAVDVVILDLSLLAAEVLENVTALIGRLVLEFLQRLGEHGGEESRGSLPVVLVLEEAQNYIGQPRFTEEESIARIVFERIAREGRKYGLSLVVASQRPSELSKTVLSQCSNFIVHRLQNPDDLRYFKEIVPGIYGPMLEQVPALAPQTALVLGECVPAPALVKIHEARPVPRSRDPKFYRYWTADSAPAVDVEGICEQWESGGQQ
jgi:ABC-type dipeptide/oligopeptide/nickel transport system ATPase component